MVLTRKGARRGARSVVGEVLPLRSRTVMTDPKRVGVEWSRGVGVGVGWSRGVGVGVGWGLIGTAGPW